MSTLISGVAERMDEKKSPKVPIDAIEEASGMDERAPYNSA